MTLSSTMFSPRAPGRCACIGTCVFRRHACLGTMSVAPHVPVTSRASRAGGCARVAASPQLQAMQGRLPRFALTSRASFSWMDRAAQGRLSSTRHCCTLRGERDGRRWPARGAVSPPPCWRRAARVTPASDFQCLCLAMASPLPSQRRAAGPRCCGRAGGPAAPQSCTLRQDVQKPVREEEQRVARAGDKQAVEHRCRQLPDQ